MLCLSTTIAPPRPSALLAVCLPILLHSLEQVFLGKHWSSIYSFERFCQLFADRGILVVDAPWDVIVKDTPKFDRSHVNIIFMELETDANVPLKARSCVLDMELSNVRECFTRKRVEPASDGQTMILAREQPEVVIAVKHC